MTTSVCLRAPRFLGESTLRVLRAYPEEFRLHSCSVHSNWTDEILYGESFPKS
ncbi:hypothetical protein LEP1GSC168_0796 [Leptospira santarosai str. HAI134]|nr:hypothetical protein LEP1GSC168_0796 [Leptospira santarosai str. HAI134]